MMRGKLMLIEDKSLEAAEVIRTHEYELLRGRVECPSPLILSFCNTHWELSYKHLLDRY